MKISFQVVAAVAFGVAISANTAHSVTFSDGTFSDSNWSLAEVDIVGGGTVTAGQVGTGGNPGSYRSVTNTLNSPAGSAVWGFHAYGGSTYDPSAQGAILSIDYSEDAICPVPGGNCFGQGQSTGAAVRQGGDIFFASGNITSVTQSMWSPISISGLVATNFVSLTTSLNPDFSTSGGVIEVGFFRANSTTGGGYTINAGIDNWVFTINTASVPEPATLALFGLGLAGLGLTARRRKTH